MPVQSRQARQTTLKHVIENVLGKGEGSNLAKALVAYRVIDIHGLMEAVPGELEYENDEGAIVPVLKSDQHLVSILQDFEVAMQPITDWLGITAEDFDQFRTDRRYAANRNPGNPLLNPPSQAPLVSPSNSNGRSPADIFRRGIKRDQSLFPTLKDEKYNDQWHRSFINQVRAQDVEEVLNPLYTPTSVEEQELFAQKQCFLYAVLDAKVLTDNGKSIIRKYEDTGDAQKAYNDLKKHHLASTGARIDSSKILTYITSARLGNGEWRGTTENFILHWMDQIRLYERQVKKDEYFSDGQKRTMLENAVSSVDDLRRVKVAADLDVAKGGQSLTFEQYLALLQAAAATHDAQYAPRGPRAANPRRSVYSHNILDSTDDDYEIEQDYDIDIPVTVIEANAHQSRPVKRSHNGPRGNTIKPARMPRDRWFQLGDAARKIWDTLSEKDKAVILGKGEPGSGGNKSTSSHTNDRQVNLHETSVFDFLQAHVHELEDNEDQIGSEDNFQDAQEDPQPEPNESVLINAAQSGKNLKPGDIRRVLSQAAKKTPPGKGTVTANVHCTYQVSSHNVQKKGSLVDGGANGGTGGSDVRMIHKTQRIVDVQGIDNHRVTNVDIGTVGGVVHTQNGPAIAIMHQYALFGKGHSIHAPGQLRMYGS